LNNYTERWTKDTILKLYYPYPSNYSISVENITFNPQNIIPEINEFNGFYITFIWDVIQEKQNANGGRINLEFDVILYNENDNAILSTGYPPSYKVKVEDVGEYKIDEKGVIIQGH
jgi:hypothetical protein